MGTVENKKMLDKKRLIQKANEYYDSAIKAYESKRYATAKSYLNQCLKINPEDHEAWTLLASCLEKDAELIKATLAFKKAYEIKPDAPTYNYNYGLGLIWIGKFTEGTKCLKRFLELAPSHKEAEKIRKLIKKMPGKLSETKLSIEEEQKIRKVFDRAKKFLFEKNYLQAIKLYKMVLQNKVNHKGSINDLGLCYSDLKDYGGALECFNKILEKEPEDPLALVNRAIVYRELNLLDKMEADIILLSKQRPIFYRDCIRVAVQLGRLKKDKLALRFFEMSYQKQKDDPELYYYWGIALANTGKIEEALQKWNVISRMHSSRLENYICKAREILVAKRKHSRFEYIKDEEEI
ncbi:tetratricopeptide repeat protein [Candidatus Aerophobetes bacterium]|nr:tetratricopeptide repeat protein [Candidatus Aerophobetes bacterium]